MPVSKAPSIASKPLLFTFNADLLRQFVDDPQRMKKPYECALKYGFRGYSAGGKNGVFLLRKQDRGLHTAIETLVERNAAQIEEDLDCALNEIEELRSIKIVAHDPSGTRIVGVMDEHSGRAIFLGFGSY